MVSCLHPIEAGQAITENNLFLVTYHIYFSKKLTDQRLSEGQNLIRKCSLRRDNP
jgi:hypothetical protein